MRTASLLGSIIAGAATATVLAGCSGDGMSPGLAPRTATDAQSGSRAKSSVHRDISIAPYGLRRQLPIAASPGFAHAGSCPKGPVGFISDYTVNDVYEIDDTPKICMTLTGFSSPVGLATDKNGNLYVANQFASAVVEFAPPYNGPPINTFADPGELPVDVAVDGNGNLAVLSDVTTNFTPGDIAFYNAGATSPSRIVTGATYTSPRFGAFDKNGNLAFDDFDEFNTDAVNLGAVRKNGTSIVPLTFNNVITFPGGVQFTSKGQLSVLDQSDGQGFGEQIYTYDVAGSKLGSPVATTVLQDSCDPIGFAFTPNDARLVTADTGGPDFECGLPIAELYRYPNSGPPILTIQTLGGGQPTGAAFVPTEQFDLR